MSDIEITTNNDEGFGATSSIGEFELSTHAQADTGPSPNEVVVADYAQCFAYAFRATGMRGEVGDVGAIQTEAEATLDEEDDLEAISFTMHVEADLTDDEVDELLAGAEDLCHVRAALKPSLHAEVTVRTDA
jgi:uncharacterized OsmC-like protein